MNENREITHEMLEALIEEITREVLERISTEGFGTARGKKCPNSQNHKCPGDYTCPRWYKCVGSAKHACPGVFECANIHKWKLSL